VPVLSVGNLHIGGSGKTPLVAAIARRLRDQGREVAILSRGYGRATRGLRYASRGEGPEGTAAEVGDEPRMLAEELPDVPVVVAEDRHAAGLDALRALQRRPDVFLLDDGFSHLALARDLELLAFPAHRPWGNGRLLPFGSLRETLWATRVADAAILTGAPVGPAGAGAALADRLRAFGFAGAGFAAGLHATLDPEPIARRIVLATGVARPERALRTARGLGLDVVEHLAFADHHPFPARSVRRIARAVEASGAAAVVVTAKDHAKLAGRLEVPVVVLRVTAEPEAAFWSWLAERLEAL
jgi:tetraacyldisaccharide 4'-kinase